MTKDMRRTILKIRVLMRIKMCNAYPYAIIKEYGKDNHFAKFIGPTIKNDIYNALSSLERSGYIKVASKPMGGKAKKYYTITKKGMKASASVGKAMKHMLGYANMILK